MTDFNDDAKGIFRRVEVLTGPGRRRRWSDEQKMQVVAEAMEPGAVISQIARRCQIFSSQVFTWRYAAVRATPSHAQAITPAFVPIVEAADASGANSGEKPLETRPDNTASRPTEVVINDLNLLPAQLSRSLSEAVLAALALQIVVDLVDR